MENTQSYTFQAEIQQVLNILIHSLYKDREIFLRELISNASDALNRLQFEMLTNRDVLDADQPLTITLIPDADKRTLIISDTGIGMTAEEMVDSLGVIARSGAKNFLEQVQSGDGGTVSEDIIGQFGVGFYSVFMVAERVEVISRSFDKDAEAAMWVSDGESGYEIMPTEKDTRGTDIIIYLREDADEFTQPYRLTQIIKRHSDYVNFPIYIQKFGEEPDEDPQPVNQQAALWRKNPNEVEQEEYDNFYQTLTLDFQPPQMVVHTRSDAPVQLYSVLFVPSTAQGSILSPRIEPGLKLYNRKVLIQEYTTDLLPEYLVFVQGVVDSEDLPLNVSRETIQSNPMTQKIKRILTKRVLSELKTLSREDPEKYAVFWKEFGQMIKQGVFTHTDDQDRLLPLLRFYSDQSPDELISFENYIANFAKGQNDIYYVVAEGHETARVSPHLDAFRARGIDVLYMTDTVDGFLVPALLAYEGHKLIAADSEDLDLDGIGTRPEQEPDEAPLEQAERDNLVGFIKEALGEQVVDVRESKVLSLHSPARLAATQGSLDKHQQRLYKMLEQDFSMPTHIFEVNPRHPILKGISARIERGLDQEAKHAVDVLYQSALLADGLHPNPAELTNSIQALLAVTLADDV